MTGEIRLPMPHQGQKVVRQQAKRFNWLAAGRRWRKTTLLVAIGVERALPGRTIVWGAPTFDQVRIGWGEMRHGVGNQAKFTQQRMTAEFPTGGKVIFRSLDDPNNARGHTADEVIIDEVEAVKPDAWYEVLRPMLVDTGGGLWAAGTPLGRNWFHKEHMAARDRNDAACWQIPTLGCEIVDHGQRLVRKPHPLENPFIEFDEILGMFQTLPLRTFRQEILAEFIEGEGAVFRNIKTNLYPGNETPANHEEHNLVMGVDWGKDVDFTALSVVCADCALEVALDRFQGVDYRLQRQRLQVLAERWGVYSIIAESNAMGTPIIEELQWTGLPVTAFATTATSKPPLIESLVLAFERSECRWLDVPIATAELEAYERKTSATTGRPTYSAPTGLHDDTVMARALAWHGAVGSAGSWLVVLD
jgi:hypothetical protein